MVGAVKGGKRAQVLLRIPEAMREKLEEAAEENGRSLTAEVLARLESTFPSGEVWLSKAAKSPAVRMEKRLAVVELGLQDQIDQLKSAVADLERRLDGDRRN